MPSYYIYLVSSLPMLQFGMKPPFPFERFLEICGQLIPDGDARVIEKAAQGPGSPFTGDQPTMSKWRAFDTALRNELVKIRAVRKKLEAFKYLREGAYQ